VVYFFVIEGKDRTLEELDWMYVNHVKPWESSKYEIPRITYHDDARGARKENTEHAEVA
jgi:hypothetical protein